jgi:hypothetical protein
MTTSPGYKIYPDDAKKAALYNHRLAVAERDFQRWAGDAKRWWDTYEDIPVRSQATAKGHKINVTTGVSVIDALFSGLTAVDVEFVLEAAGSTTVEQALLAEIALNQEWTLNDIARERNQAIKDALIVGIGFVKVGYDFFAQEYEADRHPDAIRAEVQALIAEAQAFGHDIDVNTIANLVPDREMVKEVMRDRIVTDYVPWEDIRWDPKARQWNEVKWVAQLTKMPLEDIKEHPLWAEYMKRSRAAGGLKQLDRIRPDSTLDREILVTGKPDEDDSLVTVVEYWDLETGTFCVLPKGQNIILFEGVNPNALQLDYEDRNPFVPLVLRATNRHVRGISDMEVMIRSLNEKNLYRSRLANYIDRFVPKVLAEEDIFTDEGKKALASNEYGEVVSVARGQDVHNIVPMTPPVLPIEVFNMPEKIDNEIREATGVNELMRGLFPDRKRTATETNSVVSASAARQSEKRNTLEVFHVEIARRVLTLMQKFYDQPRMARFSDPSLGNVPWEFTGDQIVGQFALKVNLSPKEAETRDALKQEATVALNILGPFAQPGPDGSSALDRTTLMKWFLRKYGFSQKDITELLTSPADQQVQAAGAAQQAAGGPPPGPLTPDQLLAASNSPATLGAAVGGAVPPEQTAVQPPVNRTVPPGL